MKKIAFITHHDHTKTGGVSTYNRVLYENLSHKYSITEFPIYKTSDKYKIQNRIEHIKHSDILCSKNTHSFLGSSTYNKKSMKYIYNNYDIVVLSVIEFPKKWISHPKSVIVQHQNYDFYSFLGKFKMDFFIPFGFLFGSMLFGLGTIRNGFKKASNVVFYSEETGRKVKGNIFYIPLAPFNRDVMKVNEKTKMHSTWMARLNRQKNPLDAVKIANVNAKLKIYGDGKLFNTVNSHLVNKKQFGGLIKMEDRITLFNNTKTFIVTSRLEGFCYTVAEALSFGVPVVMYDSFDGAKYFDKCEAVFLIKKGDWKSVNSKLKEIDDMHDDDYKKIQNHAIQFARDNLTAETFLDKWNAVIKTILDNDKQ